MRSSAFAGDTKEKKIKLSKPRKAPLPKSLMPKEPKLGKPVPMVKTGKKKPFGL
jgi:hypothetical protein